MVYLSIMKRTKLAKKGKSETTILQKEADRLLQLANKKLRRKCECCGGENQVGHHWIEKSRSSNLRYNLENIIPLCNSCHAKIHNVFGNNVVGGLNVAQSIIDKRGTDWKERMDREGKMLVKVDILFYQQAIEKLCTV